MGTTRSIIYSHTLHLRRRHQGEGRVRLIDGGSVPQIALSCREAARQLEHLHSTAILSWRVTNSAYITYRHCGSWSSHRGDKSNDDDSCQYFINKFTFYLDIERYLIWTNGTLSDVGITSVNISISELSMSAHHTLCVDNKTDFTIHRCLVSNEKSFNHLHL